MTTFDSSSLPQGLMTHQQEGVDWLMGTPRAVLADEVGTGKTVQVCAVIGALRDSGNCDRVLWVTEKQLIPQARAVLADFLPSLTVADSTEKRVVSPSQKQAREFLAEFGPNGPDVWVVSYETLKSRTDFYAGRRWSVVVLDEVSAIKGGRTEHKAVCAVTAVADRVVAMTATPSENTLMDIYSILDCLGLSDLPSRAAFGERYIEWGPARTIGNKTWPPFQIGLREEHLPELHDYLRRYMKQRSATDAGLPLPVMRQAVQWVQLTPDQASYYSWVERTIEKEEWRRMALANACNWWPKKGGRSAKAETAVEILRQRPTNEKAVVWADNIEHLAILERGLRTAGISFLRIEGNRSQEEREAIRRQFRTDPAIRVLTGTVVLERGTDGLQVAPLLISLGSSFNPGREQQREGRVRRVGSPHPTVEHITILTDTEHERKKWERVQQKATDNDTVMAFAAAAPAAVDLTDAEMDELFAASQEAQAAS